MRDPGRIAVIAGSGLDRLASHFASGERVAFEEIGLGAPTVQGHRGHVVACADRPMDLVLGRRHFYESAHEDMEHLIRWLAERGTTELISVSAAGSLQREAPTGEIVVASDVIDLQNRRPPMRARTGPVINTPAVLGTARGGGAPLMPPARPCNDRLQIDRHLAGRIESAAARAGVGCGRGVIACGAGPTYETHAEVRWLQEAGADLVTMSAAPELAAANRRGIRIAVVAVLTNPGTGIGSAVPGHDEVLDVAGRAVDRLAAILSKLTINK